VDGALLVGFDDGSEEGFEDGISDGMITLDGPDDGSSLGMDGSDDGATVGTATHTPDPKGSFLHLSPGIPEAAQSSFCEVQDSPDLLQALQSLSTEHSVSPSGHFPVGVVGQQSVAQDTQVSSPLQTPFPHFARLLR
jgi:hypothetical protein